MSNPPSEAVLDGAPQFDDAQDLDRPSYLDPSLPPQRRIDDLLSRLTLAERVRMLHQRAGAVPRLGLAAFRTGTEALHGVAWLGEATVFPQAVGLGATWDPQLLREVGTATAREVRTKHRLEETVSLNVWAPVVNLLRDPRWGRNEEGYSEDTRLSAISALAYCRGLRGDHPFHLRTAPLLKHFYAHNNEIGRDVTSSSVRPRVLHEYDLPAFREPIEAGLAIGVMPSYNLVNGRPNHVSPLLATLREWGGDDVLVCSDAGAPENLVSSEHYFADHAVSHAAALRAGVDSYTDALNETDTLAGRFTEALERGLITEGDVDRAVRRLLMLRLRLGEFDPQNDPFEQEGELGLAGPAHRELALRAARAQVVLLRNDDSLLPLAAETSGSESAGAGLRVAVVGPLANTLYQDWYSGTMPYQVTIADGLAEALTARSGSAACIEGFDRLRFTPILPGPSTASFEADVADWGQGVFTLRLAGNGRYVSVKDDDRTLVADQTQPNGWNVHESFRLEPAGEGVVVLRNIHPGGYVVADPRTLDLAGPVLGGLTASAETPETATRFAVDVIQRGVAQVRAGMGTADVVVAVVGNDPHLNGRETEDRATLALPPSQRELVRAVAGSGRPAVLVVMSSYPFALPEEALGAGAAGDPESQGGIKAVLWTSHGGQETGRAVADVLLGEYAPTARLPQTWYRGDDDLPDILEYDIVKARRTYSYFRGDPLFAFGHGLTYGEFSYGAPTLEAATIEDGAIEGGATVRVQLPVTNLGERTLVEVVQLYSRQVDGGPDDPLRRLQTFVRIELAAGGTGTATLEFPAAALAQWDVVEKRLRVAPGEYELLIGRSSVDVRRTVRITIAGERRSWRPVLGRELAAVDFDDYESVTLVDTGTERGDAVAVPARGSIGLDHDGIPLDLPESDVRGWITFKDAQFGTAPEPGAAPASAPTSTSVTASVVTLTGTFRARVGRAQPGTARIEVRRGDAVDGLVIAALEVPSTGGRYDWTEVTAPIELTSGVADLHLVLIGRQRLDTFRIDPPGRHA